MDFFLLSICDLLSSENLDLSFSIFFPPNTLCCFVFFFLTERLTIKLLAVTKSETKFGLYFIVPFHGTFMN